MPKSRSVPSIKGRESMIAGVKRSQELVQAEQYQEAKELLLKLNKDAVWSGVESAYLYWGLAISSDYLGELEEAFSYIGKAMKLDPLSPQFQHSFEVITNRIRAALTDKDRDPGDESTPKLYKMLVQAKKTDEGSHLAMARFLHTKGKNEEALTILDALTTLTPVCKEGWALKAAVARALGKDTLASQAEVEAECCGAGDAALFAQPGPAQG